MREENKDIAHEHGQGTKDVNRNMELETRDKDIESTKSMMKWQGDVALTMLERALNTSCK